MYTLIVKNNRSYVTCILTWLYDDHLVLENCLLVSMAYEHKTFLSTDISYEQNRKEIKYPHHEPDPNTLLQTTNLTMRNTMHKISVLHSNIVFTTSVFGVQIVPVLNTPFKNLKIKSLFKTNKFYSYYTWIPFVFPSDSQR